MSERNILTGIAGITLVFLIGGIILAIKMDTGEDIQGTSVQENSAAKVMVTSTTHDWGRIGINSGDVEASFPITNEGAGPLVLSDVKTSCMCTTAQLLLGDQRSPMFGMHSKSRYTLTIPPQATAQLRVVFDPAYHGPNGVGSISRQVVLRTNDPTRPELTFYLTATVVRE